jgi:hypothetical protein
MNQKLVGDSLLLTVLTQTAHGSPFGNVEIQLCRIRGF